MLRVLCYCSVLIILASFQPVMAQSRGEAQYGSLDEELVDMLAAEIVSNELLTESAPYSATTSDTLVSPLSPIYHLVAGCSAETKNGCSCEAEGKKTSCKCGDNTNGPGKSCTCSDGTDTTTCKDGTGTTCECKSSGANN